MATLAELKLRHRREVGDLPSAPPDFEAEAEQLLAHCDGTTQWAGQWAELAETAGWPCYGFTSWSAWADDVARLRRLTAAVYTAGEER